MNSGELRKKYLDFFKEKGHAIVPSSSLVPVDPSVLLTTAGMQQFKPYYLEEKSPYGDSVASIQKCFRTSDLDSIGDESHLSFFEMLGNFSFGDYFKEGAIKYAHEFITKEIGLKIDHVSVFEGDSAAGIPEDKDSEKIWKSIDPFLEVVKAGKADNFWGPTGEEGPCGPTTEIYINGIEIWNIVFNEYYRDKSGHYERLKTPGVDTGMGLERLAMVSQDKKNIFETDLFALIMNAVQNNRIAADHMRGIVFLIADGVTPLNIGRGYILRRLIRRIATKGFGSFMETAARVVIENYKDFYPELEKNRDKILRELKKEKGAFEKTFEKGVKKFEEYYQVGIVKNGVYGNLPKRMRGRDIFELVTTYGFPLESIQEIAKERDVELDIDDFNELIKQHKKLSRTAAEGMFKSGLADHSEQVIKYHTATHLLLAALRKVLGEHVFQKGSNITSERMRFDFSHREKMTPEQIRQVEDLVNRKIQEDLPVKMEEMRLDEAKNQGAMGVFESKYGEKVKVYSIGDFSKEICGGPHAERTGILGKFKIIKEEAISAGVRRIKAALE